MLARGGVAPRTHSPLRRGIRRSVRLILRLSAASSGVSKRGGIVVSVLSVMARGQRSYDTCSLFMHARTENTANNIACVASAFESELLNELNVALVDLGLDVAPELVFEVEGPPGHGRPDAVLSVNGQRIVVEVKAAVTETDAGQLVQYAGAFVDPVLVVSRRIAEGARHRFRAAGVGYLDGRGHLRLIVPGVFVDTDVEPMVGSSELSPPFEGDVAKEVAIAILNEPRANHGPRSLARKIARVPSAVAGALDRLRANDLLTSENEPMVPDLFWALAAIWGRGRRTPLANEPEPRRASQNKLLQLGLHEDVGWALTDTLAAQALGMPIVVSRNYPPDFYVPSIIALQRATRQLGRAEDPDTRACTAAVAPVPLVCRWREGERGTHWQVANHVVVALDIAQDESRGRELLDRWALPEDIVRVW
jgi:hypothetical protein